MAGKEEDISLDDYAKLEKNTEYKGNNGNQKGWNNNNNYRNSNSGKAPYFRNNNDNNNGGGRFNNFRNNGRQGDRFNQRRFDQDSNNNQDDSFDRQKVVYIVKDKEERVVPEHKKRILKVYNLDPSINNEEFYQLFVKYGSVEQSKVDTDKKGKSEEKGYVVYRDHTSAKRAIDDLNGVELEGRIITVEFMKEGETIGDSSRSSYNRDNDRQDSGILHKRIQKDDRYEIRDFRFKKEFNDDNRGTRNDKPRYNNSGNGGFNRKFNRQ